ncbi:uncharacterized protein LOC107265884 [Cephus cinctus]|uniref:Uncharacterized protein LOC107265884 n=1 Tax=Cephus cinctus TaxID=211228 RepID=A0AAJ7BQ73_CEPCN|nr:uncharacterized protein LOC107265884 [Cephus cinctus]XP_015591260.1 uncharacterized protein LOC107265884 [Cephus cinctus]
MALKTCCCCIPLKEGTITIGILGIILSVINIITLFTTNIRNRIILIEYLDKSVVVIILTINLIMTILISTLLIIGAIKRNIYLMLPWVILGIMCVVGLVGSVLYTVIMLYIQSKVLDGSLYLLFGILAIVIYLYIWGVVYSYFQEVRLTKNDGKMGPYGKPYYYRRP